MAIAARLLLPASLIPCPCCALGWPWSAVQATTGKDFLALVPMAHLLRHQPSAGGSVSLSLDNTVRVALGAAHATGEAVSIDRCGHGRPAGFRAATGSGRSRLRGMTVLLGSSLQGCVGRCGLFAALARGGTRRADERAQRHARGAAGRGSRGRRPAVRPRPQPRVEDAAQVREGRADSSQSVGDLARSFASDLTTRLGCRIRYPPKQIDLWIATNHLLLYGDSEDEVCAPPRPG